MSIRPKTKRRLFYLLVTAVFLVGSTVWFFSYRLKLAEKRIQQDKVAGLKAYAAGDYPTAIEKLSAYVTKHKDDPEALLPFGIARSKIPTMDGSHITQAISLIRIYNSLRPGDMDAAHLLLELQTPLPTYAGPALLLANDMFRNNPGDLVALKSVVEINSRARRFDDAWPAAQKYTQMAPTDLEVQERALYIMREMGKPAQELRDRTDNLQKQYPDDPRFLLLKASAYSVQGPTDTLETRQANTDAARRFVVEAAAKEPPDAQFVRFMTTQLDHIGEYNLSQNLLDRAVVKINDPELTRVLVQRLWQNHKYAEVISRLDQLDLASPTADVQLIAYKALANFALNKTAERDALVANLAARSNDRVAYAWALALRTHFEESKSDVKSQLTNYRDALQRSPDNAVIQIMLGDAYAKIGENDLALQAWRQAAGEVPSWAEPQIRIAEVLASEGMGSDDEAVIAARQALLTSAQGPGQYDQQGAIAKILVDYAGWQSKPDAATARTLLENLKSVQTQIPGEAYTLPIYAAVLAQTGQRDEAIAVIKGGEKQSGPEGEGVLLKLAKISRISKLGLEPEIYAAAEQQYGLTARIAFARATFAMEDGHADQGLKILQDAKTQGAGVPQIWDRVICQYRELSHDPGAAKAWQALGDAYPSELSIQSLIIVGQESAWSNRTFMDRSINRLKDLTGEQATAWKVARARWLLGSDDIERDANNAVVLLNDVIKNSTADYRSRVLLALAYEKLKDRDDAVAQWQQAAVIQPNSAQILFSLMRSLHAAGKTSETRATFDKLAGFPTIPADVALQAAAIMAQEGELARAQTMLERYPSATNPNLHDATLAKVYRLQGRITDAAGTYFKLQQAQSLDIMTIREAADFFGSQHDLKAANRFLDRSEIKSLPTDQRNLLLADFQDYWGDPAVAAKLYTDAVAASDSSNAVTAQIGSFIRHQKFTEAQLALDAAKKRFGPNADLANLQTIISALAGSAQMSRQTALVRAVSRDPANPAGQETLQVIAQSQNADPAQTIQKLSALLTKYPDYLPLYELTIPQLLRANRADEAVSLAAKILIQFSTSEDAARIATQTYVYTGRWNDVMVTARQWRQRDAAHPQDADMMIALADMYSNQDDDAVSRLASYIPAAQANPDANENLLVEYAESLVRAGKESDAAALLQPLAKDSPKWRADWLAMAVFSHADGPSTVAWIEQVRPLLDAHSLPEQQHLADAYFDCGTHRDYPAGFELARDALKPFVGTPQMTVPATMTYASAADAAHDAVTAEAGYRQAIKMDPNQIIAKNNLAEILRSKGDAASLKEAESLARAAIAVHPSDPGSSTYYDTLAHVLLAQQRNTEAVTAFEDGNRVQPRDLNILIGLAAISARDNRISAASRYLAQIEAILPAGSIVVGEVKQELDTARDLVKKANTPSTLSGTQDPSSPGK
jgi:cytochrome c-type biogenesis protein CcmH/NrfG